MSGEHTSLSLLKVCLNDRNKNNGTCINRKLGAHSSVVFDSSDIEAVRVITD